MKTRFKVFLNIALLFAGTVSFAQEPVKPAANVTEHSFQGISPSLKPGGGVTHVSGTMCYLCLRLLKAAQQVRVLSQKPQPTIRPTSHCFIQLPTPRGIRQCFIAIFLRVQIERRLNSCVTQDSLNGPRFDFRFVHQPVA
jgi:hypothetical protein